MDEELDADDQDGLDDFYDMAGPGLFDSEATVTDRADEPDDGLTVDEPTQGSGADLSTPTGAHQRSAEVEPEPASTPASEPQPEVISGLPEAPLALYRRYRPDTFADVIGQEQVTEPLMRAIANNRVNHAYLFSGPRGCGKTSSARILARCLNCEQGPTPTPCGHCRSCRELATGGLGSIDVIEIDAASHGRVDDARELREAVYFAPVQSRYKIYIIDEAHQVTKEGFNALLKTVEEPPPHVKFIFATTEPDKVIGTIRSRTHHYPFRLVPPRTMSDYLQKICDEEGVQVEPGVLSLVVRAGAGSVRDSLSVLDQLLGAAGEQGVSYRQATGLLGYTPDALLDEIVDAFAAGDAKGVFGAVDKVIETGQDPRRFAEDLLQRLRDLLIVAQVPDAISSRLIDVAADQAERLTSQATSIGAGELTRGAEVLAEGLIAMRGTTAPRLHLELMCARMLLPGADVDGRGIHARLERLERRIGMLPADAPLPDTALAEASQASRFVDSVPSASPPPTRHLQHPHEQTVAEPIPARQRPAAAPRTGASTSSVPATQPSTSRPPAPSASVRPGSNPTTTPPTSAPQRRPASQPGALSAADLRRVWPDVLEKVKSARRFTWILLSQNAHVADVSTGVLTLSFSSAGAKDSFSSGGSIDVLHDCLIDVIGADLRIVTQVDAPTGPPSGGPSSLSNGRSTEHVSGEQAMSPTQRTAPTQRPVGAPPESGEAATLESAPNQTDDDAPPYDPDDAPSPDDDTVDDLSASASELVINALGAKLIDDESS